MRFATILLLFLTPIVLLGCESRADTEKTPLELLEDGEWRVTYEYGSGLYKSNRGRYDEDSDTLRTVKNYGTLPWGDDLIQTLDIQLVPTSDSTFVTLRDTSRYGHEGIHLVARVTRNVEGPKDTGLSDSSLVTRITFWVDTLSTQGMTERFFDSGWDDKTVHEAHLRYYEDGRPLQRRNCEEFGWTRPIKCTIGQYHSIYLLD